MSKINKKELLKKLIAGDITITYKKKSDGDKLHDIVGTLQKDVIEDFIDKNKAQRERKVVPNNNDDIIHFLAPDRKAWRCVRVDSIVEVKSVNDDG